MKAGCMTVARNLTEMTEHVGREAAAPAGPPWLTSSAVREMQRLAADGKPNIPTADAGHQQSNHYAFLHRSHVGNQHHIHDASDVA